MPPVSSLSPTLRIYTHQLQEKNKSPHMPYCRLGTYSPAGHLLSLLGTYSPTVLLTTLGTSVLDLSFLPSFLSLSIHPHFPFSCCLLKTIKTSLSKHASFRMQGTTLLSCL